MKKVLSGLAAIVAGLTMMGGNPIENSDNKSFPPPAFSYMGNIDSDKDNEELTIYVDKHDKELVVKVEKGIDRMYSKFLPNKVEPIFSHFQYDNIWNVVLETRMDKFLMIVEYGNVGENKAAYTFNDDGKCVEVRD